MTRILPALILVAAILSFSAAASASVEALPPALQSQEAELEARHKAGLEEFFTALDEDCDAWDVRNQTYVPVRTLPTSPKLFRIESRVIAQCLREELWYCHSSFTADGTYRYTDCEVDAPLFDE